MKRVTTNPSKRSRQERALVLARQRAFTWKYQASLPEEDRTPIPPNGRGKTYTAEQKLAAAERDVANLEAMGVTAPEPVEYPYTVQNGIIVSPGKFEGEAAYMPEAYEMYLEGNFTELEDGTIEVLMGPGAESIIFFEDEQGFINEVKLDA